MRWCAFACWFVFLLFCARAYAEERPVVVLVPKELGVDEWPEGTQSVIAELSANGFQVIRQQSLAVNEGELLFEVAHCAPAHSVLGVVAVLREGDTGAAYVWTEHGEQVLRDDSSGTKGAVAEGAVALRVVELLRTVSLKFPMGNSVPQQPQKPEETRPEPSKRSRFNPWLGVATVIPMRTASMPLLLSLGTDAKLPRPLALDAGVRVGIIPERFDTMAGRISLSAVEIGGRIMAETNAERPLSLAVGFGASSLWLRDSASGSAGYSGRSDRTQVTLLATRGRITLRHGRLFGVAIVDPCLTLPTVSVRSTDGEVAHLNRLWLAVELGVGWSL